MRHFVMRFVSGLAGAAVLSVAVHAGAQSASVGPALAIPIRGQITITDMGRAKTHMIPTPIVATGGTSQREDLDLTIPVLGIPLRGQTSLMLEAHMRMVLVSATASAHGQADRVVLHGPAGDAVVSFTIDQPMNGLAGYDPADAAVRIEGTGGTGMFQGVRLRGDLKGAFKPAGTLYLGYPSPEAALAAIRGGLAQNAGLSDAGRAEVLGQAQQALTKATVGFFPANDAAAPAGRPGGAPAQAAVASAIQQSGGQARVALRIVVPQGGPQQQVKIITVEPDGSQHIPYVANHAPGQIVATAVSGTPPFVVLIYVDGRAVPRYCAGVL